jgi:TonB-linked SusC/RagA family outer membrane protein
MPEIACVRGSKPDRVVRTRGRPLAWLGVLAAGIIAGVAVTSTAAAQGVVGGRVTEEGTRQPIPGAQVVVSGTTLGALTDAAGRFRITGVQGTEVTVVARRIGFASQTKSVTVGDTTVEFVLAPRATSLEEVVVTGTPGAAMKRELGNAVATVDAAAIQKVAPVQSFQELLNGRAPNVDIALPSGQVGSGAKIHIRGTSSFDLSQTPLIYVDGVRIDNDQATGPLNQAFGSSSISRWNDFDPEDFERVEVIKGPSAGTIYGTEASNGVIQIITKKGHAGAPQYEFSTSQGTNFIMNPEGRWPTNYGLLGGNLVSINYATLNSLYKQHTGDNIFKNGYTQKYRGAVGGGSDRFQYYVSGAREEDDGVEPNNSLQRTNARLNLSAQPSSAFRIEGHMTYATGRINLAPEAGYGGRMWTTLLMDPTMVDTAGVWGFGSYLPWQYDVLDRMYQDLGRFTGSVLFTHQPTSWFTHTLTIGADHVNTMDVELNNRVDSLPDELGAKVQQNNTDEFRTFTYSATAKFNTSAFNFATSVGAQYYTKRYEYVQAYGSVFAAQGLTAINALTRDLGTAQDVTENRTLGYYAEEQIGWKDRRYLTLALRTDKNSAFGANYKRAYYPKASVSWVMSDEPFWHLGWVPSMRLRAAYGETGEQPDQFAALRQYQGVTGPNDQPAVTPLSLGNPNLGPERGKEFEVGFDAGLLRDRLGLEFTFYNKSTANAILRQDVPGSVGAGADRFVNSGKIRNRGVELAVHGTPVRNDAFTWDASASFSYNDNKILSLGIPGVTSISPGSYQESRPGYPVGAWFLKRIVSADIDPSGTAINIMCDDGAGGQIDCANAPAVYLGSSVPNKQGSFSSTFTLWNHLRLYGIVDYQLGKTTMDGNLRIRCYFDLGGQCRDAVDPTHGNPIVVAGRQEGMPFYLISNSGFFRLREVTASYSLPDDLAARLRATSASITVAARNLHTWTSYKGLDPENSFISGSRGTSVSWDQTATPALSSFLVALNLTF